MTITLGFVYFCETKILPSVARVNHSKTDWPYI